MEKETNKKNPAKEALNIFIGVMAMLLLFSSCSSSNDSSSSTNKESAEMEIKRASCESRTNTYYKCSYSIWEDRCVCKAR